MSFGLFAWPVESEPSWPVVIAWSMSSASPAPALADDDPVGPHVHRVRSRWRIVISPSPSRFGGRDSSVMTWSWRSWSSAASSIVTIRSSFGMNDDRTLRVVVLPEPVPPDTNRFRRASMHARRNSNISDVAVPNRMRSSTVYGVCRELPDGDDGADERQRLDDRVDARAVGQARVDARARLVDPAAHRGDDPVDDPEDVLVVEERRCRPAGSCRAARCRRGLGPLTITSVIVSSLRSGSSGPKPGDVVGHLVDEAHALVAGHREAVSSIVRSTIPSILVRTSVGLASRSESNALMTSAWSRDADLAEQLLRGGRRGAYTGPAARRCGCGDDRGGRGGGRRALGVRDRRRHRGARAGAAGVCDHAGHPRPGGVADVSVGRPRARGLGCLPRLFTRGAATCRGPPRDAVTYLPVTAIRAAAPPDPPRGPVRIARRSRGLVAGVHRPGAVRRGPAGTTIVAVRACRHLACAATVPSPGTVRQ